VFLLVCSRFQDETLNFPGASTGIDRVERLAKETLAGRPFLAESETEVTFSYRIRNDLRLKADFDLREMTGTGGKEL